MIELVIEDAGEQMRGAVDHTRREFSSVRTGRASSSLLERLTVEAYGVEMRIQELASFGVPEARLLVVTPHDSANLNAIAMGEDGKQRVNAVRRAARKDLDQLEGEGGVSEDDIQRAEARLDALKNSHVAMIDQAQTNKQQELMEV